MQTVKKGQITLKMKKILSALLASAVAMSLVAGCGGEKKEDAKASDVIKVGVFLPLIMLPEANWNSAVSSLPTNCILKF